MEFNESTIRKTKTNLTTLGNGIIFFAIWSVLSTGLSMLFFSGKMMEGVESNARLVTYLIIIGIMLVYFLLHLYVGLSARGEAKGKHKTILYLIVSCLLLVMYFGFSAGEIYSLFINGITGLVSVIGSAIIELTTGICIVDIMINSIRLRKINKSAVAENGGEA